MNVDNDFTKHAGFYKKNPEYFSLIIAVVLIFTGLCSSGQIAAGTYTIPGSYPTISAAVLALNSSGISGPVIFNCAAGGGETAPGGGIPLGSALLNASTSSANTIIFETKGAGGDYLITAPVGSGSGDFIFAIKGTGFIAINAIDLAESTGNTTPTTEMEYGYAFFNLNTSAPFDGCQNDTIENCTITLNNSNTNVTNVNGTEGASGIFAEQAVFDAPTAPITPVASGDLFSNNKFYSNTIQDVTYGIYIAGSNILLDDSNDIGGNSTATRNTVQNLAVPAGATSPLFGVFATNQNNVNISYNSINDTAGAGSASTGLAIGIEVSGMNSTYTVNNNNVNLTTAISGVVNAAPYNDGIYVPGTGTLTLQNDTITYTQKNTFISSPVTVNGILTYTAGDTITNFACSGNVVTIVQNDSLGSCNAINAATTGSDNINGNTVSVGNFAKYSNATGAGGYGIAVNAGQGNISITGNTVSATTGFAVYPGGSYPGTYAASATQYPAQYYSCDLYGIYYGASGALTINNNSVQMVVPGLPWTSYINCTVSYAGVPKTLAKCFAAGGYELAAPSFGNFFYIDIPGTGTSESVTDNKFIGDSIYTQANICLINDQNFTDSRLIMGNQTVGNLVRAGGNNAILANAPPYQMCGYFGYTGGTQLSPGSEYVTQNNFSNMTDSAGLIIGIYYGNVSATITNNTIENLASGNNTNGNGNVGIAGNIQYGALGDTNTYIIDSNTISGINGANSVGYGICGGANTIAYNNVGNISGGAGAVGVANANETLSTGSYPLNSGAMNIYDNKIYNVSNPNGTLSYAAGIYLITGANNIIKGAFNVYDNIIDSVTAPMSTAKPSVAGLYIAVESVNAAVNASYNTIYLGGTGASDYLSAGIYHLDNFNTDTLLLQNNLVHNGMTPNGAASFATDFYINGVEPGTYQVASNHNMFYAGTPGPNNLIYYDGTNAEQTLADYKAYMVSSGQSQDSNSVTEANTPFRNIVGSSPICMKITDTSTVCYNAGVGVPGITRDYFDIIRAGNPGYSGTANRPTIGASEVVPDLQAIATGTSAICGACNGTATVTGTYGIPPYHYLWMPGGDTTALIQNLCEGSYAVRVTDALDSMITDTVVVGNSSTLTVNLGNDTGICTGGSLQLNAGNAGATYLWSNNATTQTIAVSAQGNYSVTVSDNGCSASDTITVDTFSLPPITITSNSPDSICANDSAQICAPDSFVSYNWSNGGTSSCIYAQNAGNFYVTVTYSNGCTALSNHVPVSFFPGSVVSTSVLGDTLSAYGGTAYQWYRNNVLLPNDTAAVLIASATGNYTVMITDSNGCTSLSNPLSYTGILKVQDDGFEIYPNPASDILRLTCNTDLAGKTFEIYDATGKLIYSSTIVNQVTDIDVSMFAGGAYVLKVDAGARMFIKE